MCERYFIPLEIIMWAVAILAAVVCVGAACGMVWWAIEDIWKALKKKFESARTGRNNDGKD